MRIKKYFADIPILTHESDCEIELIFINRSTLNCIHDVDRVRS